MWCYYLVRPPATNPQVRRNSRSQDLGFALQDLENVQADKNVIGLQVSVSSTRKCVQKVLRGRDESVMMFRRKNNDHGVVTWVITD